MTHTIEVHRFDPSDPRLGRHVHHDSRSLAHAFLPKDAKPKGVNTFWGSGTGPLNQGQIGSCTGNAAAQWLNTDFAKQVRKLVNENHYFTEDDALDLYSIATTLDTEPGQYPPDDTGSDGVSVSKAGHQLGFLDKQYCLHTFSFSSAQAGIERRPAIQGTIWTNDMYYPRNGLVKVGKIVDSNIVGGHEYLFCGVDYTEEVHIFRNSWGDDDEWEGCKPGGYFAIGFKDVQNLLANQGDVTFLNGKGASA